MSDPFMSAEPETPAELEPVVPKISEAPPVEVEAPAASEIDVVADEPPPTPKIARVSPEGVILSSVVMSAEGVILKVED